MLAAIIPLATDYFIRVPKEEMHSFEQA